MSISYMFTSKKIFLIGVLLILLVVGGWVYQSLQNTSVRTSNSKDLPSSSQTSQQDTQIVSVSNITHGHGLAVDVADSNTIYIATHHGLLMLKNEKELYQVGTSKDDYMGFSLHPTDSKVFFSSGHPSTGGNIGFQKSEDKGYSWKKISNGVQGPVDFHAMTVSPANSNLVYGYFAGTLQRSSDEGKNWEIAAKLTFPVVNLAADPTNENIIYAASPQGLMLSNDKGTTWNKIAEGFVSAIAINPADSQRIILYSQNQLSSSTDAGKTWEKNNSDFQGETPLFISYNKQSPDVIYLLTEKNSIFKSVNSAVTWSKIL